MVKAEWQNGYAEDCKSFEIGSIPVSASFKILATSLISIGVAQKYTVDNHNGVRSEQ